MKTFIIAALILINTNVFAQRQEAFFSSDSAGIKNIANLIIANTKNKYHLDRVSKNHEGSATSLAETLLGSKEQIM